MKGNLVGDMYPITWESKERREEQSVYENSQPRGLTSKQPGGGSPGAGGVTGFPFPPGYMYPGTNIYFLCI